MSVDGSGGTGALQLRYARAFSRGLTAAVATKAKHQASIWPTRTGDGGSAEPEQIGAFFIVYEPTLSLYYVHATQGYIYIYIY